MKKVLMFLICLISMYCLSGCGGEEETPQERIRRISGVYIPREAEIVYSYIGDTFSGRAPQYTVFKFEEDPVDFFDSDYEYVVDDKVYTGDVIFVKEVLPEYVKNEIQERVELYGIPEEFQPMWDSEYSYYIKEGLRSTMIYFFDSKLLIFENPGH